MFSLTKLRGIVYFSSEIGQSNVLCVVLLCYKVARSASALCFFLNYLILYNGMLGTKLFY